MLLLLALFACRSDPAPAPAGVEPGPVPTGKMRHAVILVIDTLREDAVERARTPNLHGLEALGAQRAHAWSSSTWTAPSMISMFTGMPVRQHGWDFPFPSLMDRAKVSYPRVPEVPVLAEVLRDQGFSTTGLYANRLLERSLGFARGFQRYQPGSDGQVVHRAVQAVQSWAPDSRQLLYVHLLGPHHPLEPGARSRASWGITPQELADGSKLELPAVRQGGPLEEQLYWRAYHAVVEDTDERLAPLFQALRPHLDQTLLVVTSDHGELLGEHELLGHSSGVWEVLTRVPLYVVNGPLLPRMITTSAVPDLVTQGLGVEHAWPVRLDGPGPLVSEREGAVAVTLDGQGKGMWDPRAFPQAVQFDLSADPGEAHPTWPPGAELEAAKAAFEARVPAHRLLPAEGAMGAEMLEALEALGYMED